MQLSFVRHPRSPKAQVTDDILEVVEEAFKLGIYDDRETLLYHYLSFCRIMADRLLNENKPIDLGFVKLHCIPYRSDWKDRLFTKLGRRDDSIALTPKERLYFASVAMLAMNLEKGYVYTQIEVEHTTRWWKMVELVEQTRLKRLGREQYARQFSERICNLIGRAIQIYRQWTSLVPRCASAGYKDDGTGPGRFASPFSWWGGPEFDALPPLSPEQLDRIAGEEEFRIPRKIFEEVERVPKMPVVQQEIKDMRDSKVELGEVDRPGDA
jgi:hypothetical protein